MFSHVMFGVNDLERSKKFYDALLGTLGIGPGVANAKRYFYRSPTGTFGITTPINREPATHGNGSTLGFVVQCPSRAMRSMRWMWSSVTWQSSKCKLDAKP
jgi:catechol 2,3-dioxygenase-like lactoylglutathione lyase family enzyme